jgi:hypothetical protein
LIHIGVDVDTRYYDAVHDTDDLAEAILARSLFAFRTRALGERVGDARTACQRERRPSASSRMHAPLVMCRTARVTLAAAQHTVAADHRALPAYACCGSLGLVAPSAR